MEIDPIVTKYLREEPLSPEESAALHAWISQGKGRSEMLEEMRSAAGSTSANLKHLEGIPHVHIWEKVESRIQQDGYWQEEAAPLTLPAQRPYIAPFWRRIRIAAAASILIIAGGAAFWSLRHNQPAAPETTAKTQPATDVAPGSNRATLTLADGRRINLDSSANGVLASQGNTNVTKLSSGELAYNNASAAKSAAALYNSLATPKAGQFTLTLPDGTKVWLNNASALRYPVAFTGNTRDVDLNGEAYFEVAKDAAHPFLVHTTSGPAGPATIEVLGTSFNIMAYSDESTERATLVEGSIRYSHAGRQALLKPEEQSVLDAHGNLKTLKAVNVDEVTAWKNGFFHFDHTNLESTMRQLARWYDVTVSYQGNIAPQEFVGKIQRNMPLKTVLKGLEGEHVHFKLEDRKLIVLP
ncbi:MAG TPA: FecR domain-containing protein [Puia sp.]|nr:FecR domain-containing protein [Puia sp.]